MNIFLNILGSLIKVNLTARVLRKSINVGIPALRSWTKVQAPL